MTAEEFVARYEGRRVRVIDGYVPRLGWFGVVSSSPYPNVIRVRFSNGIVFITLDYRIEQLEVVDDEPLPLLG